MKKRMFPSIMFGRYEDDEMRPNPTKAFGIQTREEGLRLTNELNRLTLPSERNINYEVISQM